MSVGRAGLASRPGPVVLVLTLKFGVQTMSSLPHASMADDATFLPVDEPGPTIEDQAWAAATFNAEPAVPAVPVNGQPTTLAEFVDDEVRSYRSQGTAEAAFIAEHLERLGQLIRWTGASTPAEHNDRMDVWDADIRAEHYDRGYSEGREAARRELSPYRPE